MDGGEGSSNRIQTALLRDSSPLPSSECSSVERVQSSKNVLLSHLFDPLDHRLQPVHVDLAVAVEEGEDGGRGRVGAADAGADQTWRWEEQNRR